MTMDDLNVAVVAPELTLLVGAGVVMIADLFLGDERGRWGRGVGWGCGSDLERCQ